MSHLLPFPPQASSRHPPVRVHMGLVFFWVGCFFFLELLLNSSKCTAISACWGCSLKIRFRACAGVLSASIGPRGRGKGQAAPTAFAAGGLLGGPGGGSPCSQGRCSRVCLWLLELQKTLGAGSLCVWFKLRALEHLGGR